MFFQSLKVSFHGIYGVYIYTYIYTRSFKDPTNCRSSQKDLVFSRKPGFCKEPIFWFLLDLRKFVQIGWTCIKFLLITSYWQLVKSARQNARSKPKQALSNTMRAFSTGCSCLLCCELSLQRDWRKSKSHNGYAWHFKSQLFRYEPSKLTIALVICIVFFLSGSGNYRFDLAKPQAEP